LVCDGEVTKKRNDNRREKALAELVASIAKIIDEQLRKRAVAESRTAEGLVTKPELARLMKVSVHTIDRWLQSGYLPCVRIRHLVRFDWKMVREHVFARFGNDRRLMLWASAGDASSSSRTGNGSQQQRPHKVEEIGVSAGIDCSEGQKARGVSIRKAVGAR
jgi:excisionase family DNA binding protein